MPETPGGPPIAPSTPDGPAARPLKTLGRVLAVLLALGILTDAASVFAGYEQVRVLERLAAGEDVPPDEIAASDERYGWSGTLQMATYLLAVILWLVWFHRAYANSPKLAATDRRFGTGWAVGAWFVPILNLFRPKQIANDIWRASDPDPPAGVPFGDWPVSMLVHVWWAAWLVFSLVSNFATRFLFRAETVEDQRTAVSATMGADQISILAGLLAVAVVVAMTRRYERRRAQLAA